MKELIGFLAVLLMFCLPALAQHRDGGGQQAHQGGSRAVGGGHIAAHGPAPARGQSRVVLEPEKPAQDPLAVGFHNR